MLKSKIKDPVGEIVFWKSDVFDLSRDTLFFLHGLTADHTMFDQQFPEFEKEYNIITWDAPAHGESRPYPDFNYGNAAAGVKKILEVCGVRKVILIGQSMEGLFLSLLSADILKWSRRLRPLTQHHMGIIIRNQICGGSDRSNGWQSCIRKSS